MTEKQELYYTLYMSGRSMGQIAQKYGVNRSTVSRIIARAENHLQKADRLKMQVEAAQKGAAV
nr:MAG TPA: Transcriptional regulatory protein RcsB factor, DNA BINDING PROTEIN.6A [Caudoviricetes sp.]